MCEGGGGGGGGDEECHARAPAQCSLHTLHATDVRTSVDESEKKNAVDTLFLMYIGLRRKRHGHM